MSESRLAERERGAALVIVLWFAVALAGIVAGIVAETREVGLEVAVGTSQVKAGVAIDSALELAIELIDSGGLDEAGSAQATLGDTLVDIVARPEGARIDLNGAPEELIAGITRAALPDEKHAKDVADAILDWRDPNDLRRPRGAEASDYRRAGLGYGPANGPFRYVGELRLVLGVTRADYAALSEVVTTATGRQEPDPASAGPVVRRATNFAQGLLIAEEPKATAEEPPTFAADETGLYSIDLRAVVRGGFTRHVRALVWIAPADAGRRYELLDYQGRVPSGVADDARGDDAG